MTASPYIAVVGGVNIDIGGRTDAPLVAGDSNPGRIRSSLGGVGRNIAHNLALLGAKVRLITALGADDGAKRVEASCADLGIDLSDSLYVPDGATSTYLFLADSNGDMALAMNDMAIYEQLTPAFLETKLTTLNAAALVVLDTNLSAESIRYLGEHCTAPLFADPVSAAKAGKLEPILGRLHTLKPNRMEAELLSGVTVTDEASLYRAALAPADVVEVRMAEDGSKACRVIVPDDQLSLAIGKEGQNARLAARLVGYKIDIKPKSYKDEE